MQKIAECNLGVKQNSEASGLELIDEEEQYWELFAEMFSEPKGD